MKLLKYILLFISFFTFLYLEEYTFFGIKFSIIWKIPLVLYLVYYYFKTKDKYDNKIPYYLLLGIMFSLKLLFDSNFPHDVLYNSNRFIKFLVLPFSIYYFSNKFKNSNDIYQFILILSIYLTIATLPYYLGVSDKINNAKLEVFGAEDDWIGFSAYFQTVHGLSIVMGMSAIIIISKFQIVGNKVSYKIFLLIVLGLCLVSAYRTFARTGWLILGISSIVLMNYRQNIKKRLTYLLIAFLGLNVMLYIYNKSEVLQNKLSDKTVWRTETSTEDLGSGRVKYWKTALNNWYESGFNVWLIGYGEQNGMDLMEKKTGMRIFAHNEFIEILQTNGIIGIILYILFLKSLLKIIKRSTILFNKRLGYAVFTAYLISLFFQSANIFWLDIIFAGAISMIIIEDKKQLISNVHA